MVCLCFSKGLSKEESLKLHFKLRQSGKISPTGRQQILERWCNETERALNKIFQMMFRNFQKLLNWWLEGARCLICKSPSYVHNGWLGVKQHQVTYLKWKKQSKAKVRPLLNWRNAKVVILHVSTSLQSCMHFVPRFFSSLTPYRTLTEVHLLRFQIITLFSAMYSPADIHLILQPILKCMCVFACGFVFAPSLIIQTGWH